MTTQSRSDSWDAALYLRFEAEHAQPARDLISRVEGVPRRIFDLGCGPGISSRLLVERFSGSEITGIDNSTRMLAETRWRLPTTRFEKVDIARWRPNLSPDLIFANDVLHWLPDHETLLPRLMSYLADRGSLAIQMPDNRHEPSHALMRLIAADGPWAHRLVPVAKTRGLIGTFADYYNWLRPLSASIEIWQTTYVYPLTGVEAVVDWFRGSALPPFLNPLEQWEREEFLDRYLRGLSSAYGFEADGRVLFLYPRLFILARKPDEHGQSCKNPQSLAGRESQAFPPCQSGTSLLPPQATTYGGGATAALKAEPHPKAVSRQLVADVAVGGNAVDRVGEVIGRNHRTQRDRLR